MCQNTISDLKQFSLNPVVTFLITSVHNSIIFIRVFFVFLLGGILKEYDIIVIGSGSGMIIVDGAVSHGLKVALVDKGPLGGTCLNVGCIPSKMLVYPADRVVEIQEAKKLGIDAEIKDIDFEAIMERMRKSVHEGRSEMERGIKNSEYFDYYDGEARFVGDYTIEVNGEKIKGERIFIASGARPLIPPIKGIGKIDYLTNDNVFDLKEKPKSMVIIGGGYVAVEFGHFFSAMGTDVKMIQRNTRLVPESEPEISWLLKNEMKKRMEIHTNTEVVGVRKEGDGYVVVGKNRENGKNIEVSGEKILVAAGRKSNADKLGVEKTGIETDRKGYIKVNEYLETTKKNVWAIGDATGKFMFRHMANREASRVWHNVIHKHRDKIDFSAVPYAVFTYPEIASVGLTEEQAKGKGMDILVGTAKYSDVAMGEAMLEHESFAKAVFDKAKGKILGFHIIGPYASILIQEVTNAMASEVGIRNIGAGMHIHPALPELIIATLNNLQEPG